MSVNKPSENQKKLEPPSINPETALKGLNRNVQEGLTPETAFEQVQSVKNNPDQFRETLVAAVTFFALIGTSAKLIRDFFDRTNRKLNLGIENNEADWQAVLRPPLPQINDETGPDEGEKAEGRVRNGRENPAQFGRGDFKRAQHAYEVIGQDAALAGHMQTAASRHEIPVDVLRATAAIESNFNPNAGPGIGFAQVMPSLTHEYTQRYAEYRKERGDSSLPTRPDFREPGTAFDYMAWHYKNIIQWVNTKIAKDQRSGNAEGFKPAYRLDAESDPATLWLAYSNGPTGYLRLRSYVDNPTPENYAKLPKFQRAEKRFGGRTLAVWQAKLEYAKHATGVAQAYASLTAAKEKKEAVA